MSEDARKGTVAEVISAFLVLGLTSFGGPVAHLGYFRTTFVGRRKWLTDAAYAELVALCQFLPGPTSSQVGIALGFGRAGFAGALAAWLAFTLPSVLLLVGFAWGLGATGWLTPGILSGLKLAALAIVAQALLAMLPTLAPDTRRKTIAVAAAIVMLVFPGSWQQVAVIAVAALVGAFVLKAEPLPAEAEGVRLSRRLAFAFLGAFFGLLVALPVLAGVVDGPELDLVDRFYRAGSLVFGGGHVVLPLLNEAVVTPGLVTEGDFLAGYGAAQAVPGPLFSFAAYLGYVMEGPAGGIGGATLALVGVYLPSFLLVFGALPFWQALSANCRARAALGGANAGVLGILGAALYNPVFSGAVSAPSEMALALAAFAALALIKMPPWSVVVGCGAIGAIVWTGAAVT